MKPIKLIIRAFGPYKGTEIIDFQELETRKLFLITGPTGAGKTTIFDAISFAMYGEANGNTRTAESLRSQFAEDKVITEVELDFELKGIKYHIHRIPRQQKLKSRGEGFTEQKSEAELIIYSKIENKVIAGVKNVNDKIEEIVGLNAEQFRQIMMIPQGEFKKLLMADSQDREKVLQKLFDTKIYNAIQNKLDEQSKELNMKIKEKLQLRNHEISNIESNKDEKLQILIDAKDKQIDEILDMTKIFIKEDKLVSKEFSKKIENMNTDIKQESSKKERTIQNNKYINEKIEIENKLKIEESKSLEIQSKELIVKNAKKAAKIEPIEKNYKSRKLELKAKIDELEIINKEIITAKTKRDLKEIEFEKERSEESVKARTVVFEELTKFKSYQSKVVQLESLKNNIEFNKSEFDKCDKEKIENTNITKKLKTSIEKLKIEQETSKDASINCQKLRLKYKEEENIKFKIEKSIELNKEIIHLEKSHKLMLEKSQKTSQELNEISDEYKKQKLALLMNQAAILAKNLDEGIPCPVCGSIHHEKLAKFTEDTITQEKLDELEIKLQNKQNQFNEEKSEIKIIAQKTEDLKLNFKESITELMAIIEDLSDDLKKNQIYLGKSYEINELIFEKTIELQIEYLDKIYLLNSENLKSITQKGKELGQLSKLHEEIVDRIKKDEQTIVDCENKGESLERRYNKVRDELLKFKEQLNAIYTEVPEEIRSLQNLNERIEEKELLKTKLDEQLNQSRINFDSAKIVFIKLDTQIKELNKVIGDLNIKIEVLKNELDYKLKEYEFENIDDYISSKLDEDSLEKLENHIKLYLENINSLKQRYKDLIDKTDDIIWVNISTIDDRILDLEKKNKELIELRGNIESRVKNNEKVIKEVESINLQIKDSDDKNKLLGHLAKIAKGDNKPRMTFERYVLATFLEDILKASNIRLSKMTNGRYHMSRTKEMERQNKQSGLELEVYDNYTGKSRHIKTLSGGESFKASLSMALGLSDFVQSYSGGVQLDTMFIDEGFGTLDQESLDSAINCLVELQKSGRLVGIISHVQDLKERIDARLEVSSTNTGSETKFVIN